MIPNKRNQRRRTSATKPDKPENRKDWVGIAALTIAIIFGLGGLYLAYEQIELNKTQIALSIKQNSTSLDLLNFAKLLRKTDSVIILSTEQLKLNQKTQDRTNTIFEHTERGNMNRLLDKTYKIEKEYISLFGVSPLMSEIELKDYSGRLERMRSLLVSEVENPYLNSSDTIYELWSIAYSSVGRLNSDIVRTLAQKGRPFYNPKTGEKWVGKIDSVQAAIMIRQFAPDIYSSVITLTGFIQSKVRKDKIRMGVLNKDGNPKVNPMDFYITSKTIKQEKQN